MLQPSKNSSPKIPLHGPCTAIYTLTRVIFGLIYYKKLFEREEIKNALLKLIQILRLESGCFPIRRPIL
jgi:hypothetical protein